MAGEKACSTLLVATANVLRTLHGDAAGAAVDAVLGHRPDLVCLQEWGLRRFPLLRRRGRAGLLPGPVRGGAPDTEYRWLVPLVGGCAVGARSDRFRPLDADLVL